MSTEYIERRAAIKTLIAAIHNDGFQGESNIERHELREDEIEDALLSIPAADVEPVVRCGKCKYADVGADGFIETCNYWNDEFNTFHLTTMHPNGYCSNGIERIIPHMDERSDT